MTAFENLPYFEAPNPLDDPTALVTNEGQPVSASSQGPLVRVLLREGLASGALKLHTVSEDRGSDSYTCISLAAASEPPWTLDWYVTRDGLDWAEDPNEWLLTDTANVFSAWPEFHGVRRNARDLLVGLVEREWQVFAMDAGLGEVPELVQCDFSNVQDEQLNKVLSTLSSAVDEQDWDIIVWGEFADEKYTHMNAAEQHDEFRLVLGEVVRLLREGTYDELLPMVRRWGGSGEMTEAVEWTFESSPPFPDPVRWSELPWNQQRELLSQSSPWVRGVAAALPNSRPEVRSWLQNESDSFVRYVLEGT